MDKTKHPEPPALNCTNCKHVGEILGAFLCRQKPPVGQAALVMGPQGPAWQTVTVWPVVTINDWCAFHAPKLDS